jgi:Zn-dependent protease/CBS domain-containing protein
MSGSIRFARVAGIDLRIHFTFLIFIAWIGFTYFMQGGRVGAERGVLFMVLLFGCVVLHELGHALTARHFGIRTFDIILLPIGGVARLERIPEKPKQEFLITAAGPMVNVLIASLLILILRGQPTPELGDLGIPQAGLLARLATANVFLAIFNLIPAFPMDGGRILRSLLAMRMDYVRATQISARIGQGLAVVFGVIGLFYNPFLIFIALFVYLGAKQEATLAQVREISKGVPVSAAMVTEYQSLAVNAQIEEASRFMLQSSQRAFPVIREDGHAVGIVMREDILLALRERGEHTPVSQVMRAVSLSVRPEDDLNEAFTKMQQSDSSVLPVEDASGKLVGLLTMENVGEMIMINSARTREGKRSWRPAHA